MSTHVTTHNPVRSDLDLPATPAAAPGSRRWALVGVAAAVSAIGASAGSIGVNAIYDREIATDADAILVRLGDQVPQMILFQVAGSICALLLAVFGLGLHRRLRSVLPSGSLVPGAAAFGLLATSVVMVMATALNTEFVAGVMEDDVVLPGSAAMYNHWVGTVQGCWILVGISALAVYAAARQGAAPRWLGIVGLVLGGLTVLVGVLPVQYMAGATGTLWLLITAIGFAAGDKAHRTRGVRA